MAAYCLFDIREILDEAAIERYRAGVLSTVQQYGGQYVVVGGEWETVEGTWKPEFPVMLRFPDMASARRWYNSPEYADLKALRLAATRGDAVFMESEPDEFVTGY